MDPEAVSGRGGGTERRNGICWNLEVEEAFPTFVRRLGRCTMTNIALLACCNNKGNLSFATRGVRTNNFKLAVP
jgi:hypothetical protein